MPDTAAVNTLANAITAAFDSIIPETDQTLPEDTRNAIDTAMNKIKENNRQLADALADAINTFVKKSKVKITVPWTTLQPMIIGKVVVSTRIKQADVDMCKSYPSMSHPLDTTVITRYSGGEGTSSVVIEQDNAIQ